MAKKTRKARKAAEAGEPRPNAGPGDATEQLPTDTDRPSATDDQTNQGEEARPTAREGLKPTGRERPHPTAAARPGKTSGQAGQPAAPMTEAQRQAREARMSGTPIQVEATQMGYYGDARRRTGDVFYIASEEDFSELWMTRTDGKRQVRVTTSKQAHDAEQRRLKAEKDAARAGGTVHTRQRVDPDDVDAEGATGNRNPLGA